MTESDVTKGNINLYRILILVLAVALCAQFCSHRQEEINAVALTDALNDSLNTFKDKDGLNHSQRKIIQTESPESFLKLKTKDKEIQLLQAEVIVTGKQIGRAHV